MSLQDLSHLWVHLPLAQATLLDWGGLEIVVLYRTFGGCRGMKMPQIINNGSYGMVWLLGAYCSAVFHHDPNKYI